MAYQHTFKRYEMKYLLTYTQAQDLKAYMLPYMAADEYGKTTIRNIYFDTDNYRLIRRSIEKPVYKEKLRLRSYQRADKDKPIFVELKKKYKSVVYKRRVAIPQQQALSWLGGETQAAPACQIGEEISYFINYYGSLQPKVFLSYDRIAYYSLDGSDLRITFDDHILCRQENINLDADIWGTSLLSDNTVLMEIKTGGGIPLWLCQWLTKNKVYKTSFSKYGTAYQKTIFKGAFDHA